MGEDSRAELRHDAGDTRAASGGKKRKKLPVNQRWIEGVGAIKAKDFDSAWAIWQAAKADGALFTPNETMLFAAAFLGALSKPFFPQSACHSATECLFTRHAYLSLSSRV
jgi:hypothetical protein